jgi:hypothetical protein
MPAMLHCTMVDPANVPISLTVSTHCTRPSTELNMEVKMAIRNFAKLLIVASALTLAACAGVPGDFGNGTPSWDSPAN